jgi:hypothetical protein
MGVTDTVLAVVITGGFTILGILVKWLIDRLDATNTSQHAENKGVLESILSHTAENGVAIGQVATALTNHLAHHAEHMESVR